MALPLARAILAEPGAGDGLITGPVSAYAKALHVACDRAEIPLVCLMDFRHSLATLLLERTQNYEYVRLVLGHEGQILSGAGQRYAGAANPTTLTRHYAHASPASLMAARAGHAK